LDHDIFATKLLEIRPGQASHLYTGRVTVFPNSLLFTNALVKENPGQEYGLYILVIPLSDQDDWRDAERHLLDAAKAECTPFMEEAGRQMKLLERTNLLEAPSPEPRITIQLSEPGRINLVAAVSGTGPRKIEDRAGDSAPISGRLTLTVCRCANGSYELARLDRPCKSCDSPSSLAKNARSDSERNVH